MSPIDGVSDIRRLPRIGVIRLGIKKVGQKGPYPSATDYFVCPEEVQAVYKEKPKELKIMFPANDPNLVAPQWYKCYSSSQGLICKGDGITCQRKVDTDTGDFAGKNTKQWVLTKGSCGLNDCPKLADKQCRKVMSLFFLLPDVPGLGVYQLNTSSFYSIVNINSMIGLDPPGYLRHFIPQGRIAFLPLILSIGPEEKNPMGEGRVTIYTLQLRAAVKLSALIEASRKGPSQVLLPVIEDEEPPSDLYPEEVIKPDDGKTPESTTTGDTSPPAVGSSTTTAGKSGATEGEKIEPPAPKMTRAKKPAERAAPAVPETAVSIDWDWLRETLEKIHWTHETAKSWIHHEFPEVDTQGKLTDVLPRLTKEQAEKFWRELQDRAAGVQPELFS